jgi:hypothetical protein
MLPVFCANAEVKELQQCAGFHTPTCRDTGFQQPMQQAHLMSGFIPVVIVSAYFWDLSEERLYQRSLTPNPETL